MARKKNPQQTRRQILEVTAHLLHRHGFKGLRVDEVVEQTGLTKGAIYHHFPNKQALGYAVVDELLHKLFLDRWQHLLKEKGDPLEVIASSFEGAASELTQDDLEIGCPLINLGQEMSFEDEGFRIRISTMFETWINQIADLLRKGIEQGSIKEDTDPVKTARFLVSSFQGVQSNSKYDKDLDCFRDNLAYLQSVVRSLAK